MPCPLCRKEFTIPDDGLSGMQKNFFMEKLLYARKLLVEEEASSVFCDVCFEASASKPATMCCVQCQQNYCEQCSLSHAGMEQWAGHVQVEIGEQLKKEEIALKLPATCDDHKGKEIKVSVDVHKQMTTDTDKVTELLKNTGELLPRFDKEKNDLIKHLANIEDEINTKADKLIAAIQRDRVQLLSEVESIRLKRLKQLETVKEVEQHMAALESFKRYSETLLSSGEACDVDSLHCTAGELIMYDVISHVDSSLPRVNVSFKASIAVALVTTLAVSLKQVCLRMIFPC